MIIADLGSDLLNVQRVESLLPVDSNGKELILREQKSLAVQGNKKNLLKQLIIVFIVSLFSLI